MKHYFATNPSHHSQPNPNIEPCLSQFIPPSNKDPPALPPNHPLVTLQEFLTSNLSSPSFPKSLPKNSNLSAEERRAIQNLKTNPDIIILPADKGSTTVVMDHSDYLAEGLRQLSDSSTYKLCQIDPIPKVQQDLQSLLKSYGPSQKLSPESISLLTPAAPRTPTFYMLPKIHKPNNPGRPIVAGYCAPTERISALVDQHLQPIVQNLPSHIKDTNHFLHRLSTIPTPLPPGSLLVTVDATSLYTNIPHAHGLAALEHYLSQRPSERKPDTSFLITLTNFILLNNYFSFEGKVYHQIQGTAMGTRMAPSYANLFMGRLEESFLASQNLKPLAWFRFIDDIFMIWTHGQDTLSSFLQNLNSFSPIHFTWSSSTNHATFLDVNLHLTDGSIHTSVHIKPTNHQQYLHFDSCHPFHIKKSLPYSLATRGRHICSDKNSLSEYAEGLTKAFTNRNYPTDLVRKQISRAISSHTPNPLPNTSNHPQKSAPLVTQYYPGLEQLNSILRQGFDFLSSCPEMRDILPKILPTPPKVVFRRPPNLHNILVHPYATPKPSSLPQGSYPCGRPRCKTCPIHPPSTSYSSPVTGLSYPIRGRATCESSHVIYQLCCKHCTAFYIGMTTNQLSIRMNGHRQTVAKNKVDHPVAQHAAEHMLDFNGCFTTRAIWILPSTTSFSELHRWELSLQYILRSRNQPGLNLR